MTKYNFHENEQQIKWPPATTTATASFTTAENGSSNNASLTSDNKQDICRDYVWGTCFKKKQCRFSHILNFAQMKAILKFCHDFQNPSGCKRASCTYLHVSKEEEQLFQDKGTIPRLLADRHAAINMPPPPPPPPTPVPIRTQNMFVQMPTKMNNVVPLPQLPPPPPPPNTPESAPSIYTAPPPPQRVYNTMSLPEFDASRPPPPILPTLKRPSSDDVAAANKKGRFEDCNAANAHCDQCLHRQQSIEKVKEQINKFSVAEEDEVVRYKKLTEDCQTKKELFRLFISLEGCVEAPSHSRHYEELQQIFASPQRRHSPPNSLQLQKLLESLSSSNRLSPERFDDIANSTSIESIVHGANIPKIDGTQSPALGSGSYVAVVAPYTNPLSVCPGAPLPARAHSATTSFPSTYPVYDHTMPPPPSSSTVTKPYYGSQYMYPSTSQTVYSNARTDVSAANVASAPAPRQMNNSKNCQSYAPGRYGQHYYQPY